MPKHLAGAESLVALFQQIDGLVGREPVSILLAHHVGEGRLRRTEPQAAQRSQTRPSAQNGPPGA